MLHETAAVSAQVLCTPYNHAPCHFTQSHIHKVYAFLAVTCHLHFWQNDRDFLRATAVTRGWNGCRYQSQHRKSTLEKKILPPLLQEFEPATFQSRVRRSNHWVRLPLATHLFLLSADVGICAIYVRPSGLQDRISILVMVPASFSWTCLRKISDPTDAMTKTEIFSPDG